LQSARCIVQKEKKPCVAFQEQSAHLSVEEFVFAQLMEVSLVSVKLL
jgi:hypothetical protein